MTLFPHILSSVEGMTLVQCWSFSMEVAKNSKNEVKISAKIISFGLFLIFEWFIWRKCLQKESH